MQSLTAHQEGSKYLMLSRLQRLLVWTDITVLKVRLQIYAVMATADVYIYTHTQLNALFYYLKLKTNERQGQNNKRIKK
jgi:hypothetical protein